MLKLQPNTLYYGDNLVILREHIPDESVDLIYLDPPFNSNRSYNVLFKESGAAASQAQIEAFEDTWHWGKVAQSTFEEIALRGSDDTARLLKAMVDALGHNDVTAYLAMMAVRLVELKRVLKPTGSIYLHCDPTASHYLKVLMDSIFRPERFRNEIAWKRTSGHSDAGRYGRVHDTLLFYCRDGATWNQAFQAYDESYVEQYYRYQDPNGRRWMSGDASAGGLSGGGYEYVWKGITRVWRFPIETMERLDAEGRIFYTRNGIARVKRYLDESKGLPVNDVWTDVEAVRSWHGELLGYPTQKPLALLERIINASSNPGDIVLDPFCGCGTAVHAAHKLGRQWIGIDITHLAIGLIRRRMEDAFPELKDKISVMGEPEDLPGAAALAEQDKYQFQWWALNKLDAMPAGGGEKKKGMDRGIDGVIPFMDGVTTRRRVIVSVKGGNVTSAHLRDLIGVLQRENEPIGVLLTLNKPTREMEREAIAAGSWHSELYRRDYPRVQIITVADLFNGKRVDMPPQASTFAQAPRERRGQQASLEI